VALALRSLFEAPSVEELPVEITHSQAKKAYLEELACMLAESEELLQDKERR
jgi:hypothetical protein